MKTWSPLSLSLPNIHLPRTNFYRQLWVQFCCKSSKQSVVLSRPHVYKVTIHLVDKIAGYLINIALQCFTANLDEDLNVAIL